MMFSPARTAFLVFSLSALVVFHALAQNTPLKTLSQKPFVLGHIDVIHSTMLAEDRTLNIYLPDGYTKDSLANYPVIYLLDGSADEDFIHIVGLVQFANFSWVHLIRSQL